MKPIYMAPTLDQADDIKQLLKQGGVETSLVKKADPNNALAPKGITWFELWLKQEADHNKAEIIIEQFEFSQLIHFRISSLVLQQLLIAGYITFN